MVSQEELEVAIARFKSRLGEGVPTPVVVGNSLDDPEEPSYPAMVELSDDGARTPVPPKYGAGRGATGGNSRSDLPPEAYRSDSDLEAVPAGKAPPPPPYTRGAAIPRGNDEPTTVGGNVADYMPEMMDSGVVELDGQGHDDDK